MGETIQVLGNVFYPKVSCIRKLTTCNHVFYTEEHIYNVQILLKSTIGA